jgi:hypothetical protein
VSFERLTIGDAIAWVAALALLLFTAVDWYSNVQGNEARQIQNDVQPVQGVGGAITGSIQQQARDVAQSAERNLWQESRAIDRLELIVLLGAALAASIAAAARVADKRFEGWLTPSAMAALLAAAGALLVLYRVVQQPGDNQLTTLKSGPWLAIIALGALGFGASLAWRREREGSAWKDEPATTAPGPAPPPPAARTP